MNRRTNLWRRPFRIAAGLPAVLVILLLISPGRSYGEDIAAIVPQWMGKLGVFGVEISRDMPVAQDIGFEGKLGLYVAGVSVGGPSHQGGVRRGDIIVKMDIELNKPGKAGSLKVLRGKELKDLPFTVSKEAVPFPSEMAEDFGARPKPITIVVDQGGKGNYRTITAALSIAAPGDTVEVRDGIYCESLVVPQGLTLCGTGKGCACVESSVPIRLFGVQAVTLRQLTLRGRINGVRMHKGKQVTLADCTISSTDGDAVSIEGADEAILQNCRVTGKERGIRLEKTKGKIAENFITGCKWGLVALGSSRVEIVGNSLDRNNYALTVLDSHVTAEKNTIVGNSHANGTGVTVRDSQITLRGNTIQRFLNGLEARQVRGEIHGNTFVQNGYGIWLRAGDLNIDGNTFLMQANTAICLVRHSYPNEKPLPDASVTARITHNTISSNSLFGITLKDKAEANIRYNLIEGNARGIEVQDASAKIINNTIVLQKLRGIELTPKSRAEVYNNIVAFNRWGIVVDVTAQWEHGFNNVFGNAATWTFPLASGDYVRCDRIPLTAGEKLLAHIYPADDLKAETDVSVDPQFVRAGKDYRLSTSSPLADRKGKDGLLLGAFAVSAQPTTQTSAIPEEWRGKIEFCDAYPKAPTSEREQNRVKPWFEDEENKVLTYFTFLQQKAPGILERATAYRPIRLYRTDEVIGGGAAAAQLEDHSIVFGDFTLRGYKETTQRHTVVHEVVHLADSLQSVSQDRPWRDIVEPRIKAATAALEKQGFTARRATLVGGDAPAKICQEHGLPGSYAAADPGEALAECASLFCVGEYVPPPDIKAFLDGSLLATPFQPKATMKLAHRALQAKEQGQPEAAIRLLSEAIGLDPTIARLYLNRADLYRDRKDFDRALADYNEAVKLNPDSHDAYISRGVCQMKKGEPTKAVADYTEGLRCAKSPEEMHSTYLNRGCALRDLKESDKAIADFIEAIHLQPRAPTAYYARGCELLNQKQYDRAIADFSKVIELVPGFVWAHLKRAETWREMMDYDKAIAGLDKLIASQPGYARGYELRARCRLDKDDQEGALHDLNEAVRQAPPTLAHTSVYALLAELLATASEPKLRDGRRALALATDVCQLTDWMDLDALQALAAASAETGDFAGAVKWQTKAAELAGDAQNKKDSQARLALFQAGKPLHREARPAAGSGKTSR